MYPGRDIRRYDPNRVKQIQAQHRPPKEGTYIGRRGSSSSSGSSRPRSGGSRPPSRGGSTSNTRNSAASATGEGRSSSVGGSSSSGAAAEDASHPSPDASKPDTVDASCFAGDGGICAGGHHGKDVHGEGGAAAGAGPGTTGGVMYPISITLMINNTQPIYLEMLPDDQEVFIECPADPDIQHKRLLNGRLELECVFFTPNECKKHRAGRLVVDNKHVLELGPLSRDNPVHCGILVDEKPKMFRLEVAVVDVPAEHPAETHLCRHVLAILENDEFFGSVSSSHLQNQVRDLPFYSAVIGPIKKKWTDFILAHKDLWDVFKYEQEVIDELDISGSVRHKEYRVCARSLLEDYQEGDVARDQVRQSAERQLHEMVLAKLRERPYEQSELLAELMKEKAFLATLTPNVTKLLDYFDNYPDRFFVLRSHLHPILVEARKDNIQDDPKFDAWDEHQRKLQEQAEAWALAREREAALYAAQHPEEQQEQQRNQRSPSPVVSDEEDDSASNAATTEAESAAGSASTNSHRGRGRRGRGARGGGGRARAGGSAGADAEEGGDQAPARGGRQSRGASRGSARGRGGRGRGRGGNGTTQASATLQYAFNNSDHG